MMEVAICLLVGLLVTAATYLLLQRNFRRWVRVEQLAHLGNGPSCWATLLRILRRSICDRFSIEFGGEFRPLNLTAKLEAEFDFKYSSTNPSHSSAAKRYIELV